MLSWGKLSGLAGYRVQLSERARRTSVCLNLYFGRCVTITSGSQLGLPPTRLSPTGELEPGWPTTPPRRQSLAARVRLDGTVPVVIAVDEMPVQAARITYCWTGGLLATGPETSPTM
jgi:hypothetical protein